MDLFFLTLTLLQQSWLYPVVLKPTESAGSDGVKLCYTFNEAQEHFETLMNSQLVNGGDCPSVLCQEFLKGDEYVVDHVSRDGVHKTVMLWVYDKRKANGGDFVYFGMKPVDPSTEVAKILINYTRRTLDVLGIKHGPSHSEIMMTTEGPCLVEVNCRAHGGKILQVVKNVILLCKFDQHTNISIHYILNLLF